MALALTAFFTGCTDDQPTAVNRTTASGPVAAAIAACSDKSRRNPGNPDRPETWGRSDYDICMADQANKTRPANADICREAQGMLMSSDASPELSGKCILVIL